jgi:hypothetical protein
MVAFGNYRGKKGSVSDKLDTAEQTVNVADRLHN